MNGAASFAGDVFNGDEMAGLAGILTLRMDEIVGLLIGMTLLKR
jgi:hypothetical protein